MNKKRLVYVISGVIVLAVVLLIGLNKNIKNNQEPGTVKTKKDLVIDQPVVITFVGDIMLDRGVKSSVNKNFNGDYTKLFEKAFLNVQDNPIFLLKNDDITLGNLEGPVSDKGHNVGSKYSFRMNPEVLSALKDSGFDIFNVANNHAGDWSIDAFWDTLNNLSLNELAFTGGGINYTEASTVKIIEKNGVKIGFLGFSDVGPEWLLATSEKPGILSAKDPKIIDIIKEAKTKSDFLIVSFHWGDEYVKQNKRQEYLAHLSIDNGADIIIGHHPHVKQDIEFYKEKPIVYSLGNFVFDQYFSEDTMNGLMIQIEVLKNGSIKIFRKFNTKQNKQFQIESIIEL